MLIVQFLKSTPSGEVGQCERLSGITVLRGTACPAFSFNMTEAQKDETRRIHDENLKKALDGVSAGEYDLLVLDEAMDALSMGLLSAELFYGLLENKPEALELVITGHEPIERVFNSADYITEMRAVRHPYDRGVQARRGIEF